MIFAAFPDGSTYEYVVHRALGAGIVRSQTEVLPPNGRQRESIAVNELGLQWFCEDIHPVRLYSIVLECTEMNFVQLVSLS